MVRLLWIFERAAQNAEINIFENQFFENQFFENQGLEINE